MSQVRKQSEDDPNSVKNKFSKLIKSSLVQEYSFAKNERGAMVPISHPISRHLSSVTNNGLPEKSIQFSEISINEELKLFPSQGMHITPTANNNLWQKFLGD